ncbi:MAG: nucleotidyltransferase [Peptostreptococcales bacterium]
MKVLGIVSEYNPFHKGHEYHLKESKISVSADFVVCVMSGNFLQRGEPALFNKWIRAEAAIKCGVDIVFELPAPYACNSAEHFAQKAISLLDRLGCVTHLSFGSESGNIHDIIKLADPLLFQSEEYKKLLKKYMDEGFSFPRANQAATEVYASHIEPSILSSPNNILGIEYMKALYSEKSSIEPITVKRHVAGYHDTSIQRDKNICSASAIRSHLESGYSLDSMKDFMPVGSYETIQKYWASGIKPTFFADFFELIQYKLLSLAPEDLKKIYSVREGIEHRLIAMAKKSNSLEELITRIKTKRYLRTGIQRMLTHILLNITQEDMHYLNQPNSHYGRLLAASSEGLTLLRHIKKKELSRMPLITNINKEVHPSTNLSKQLSYDILANDIYNLVASPSRKQDFSDYIIFPYIQQ